MQRSPYGTWQSPIAGDLVAQAAHQISEVKVDQGHIYWLEQFPEQKGRSAIFCRDPQGAVREMTPKDFSVRTRVHEYGGGDYTIVHGVLYFSNDRDQRLYRQEKNKIPTAITPIPDEPMALRYADGVITPDEKFLICVRESHHANEVINEIVAVAVNGSDIIVIASGHDFYASPRISPDGRKLAYICWDQPAMPWDETLLCIADFDAELNVRNTEVIAGGVNESVCQPKFNKLGEIYFVSDRNNWWNIYKYQAGKIQPVAILDAELGGSIFRLGSNTYEFTDTHNLICIVNAKEHYSLALISENNIKMLNTHLDYFASTLATEGDYVYAVAANAASAPTLIRLNLQNDQIEVVHSSSSLLINADYLSLPQMVEFPTANNLTAFAYFYAPHNPRFEGLPDELPPLIVITHGGPTAASNSALNLKIQYWTSRGFAVLDVNYGGSTGYGRAYRERLNQNWGIVDVEDCVNAAKYLVQQGKVDGKRLIIKGGSAGGFTVLSALTFYDIFAAGASYYGVADLAALVQETHKFEARYLDKLIGAYPEQKQIYFDRSPLHHAEKLSCPIIFFQGLEDKVVPPAQTEAMIAAMEKKSLPYAYLTFPHEQHGFRDVYSIKTSLEAELSFYSQIFNFKPADDIKFVPVKNWS